MKHKSLIAVPLAVLLSVSALTIPTFAENSEKESSTEISAEETQEEKADNSTDTSAEGTKKTKSDSSTDASGQETKKEKKEKPDCKREKKQEVEEPENAIGKDAAKAKALEDAGVTAEQTGKVRSHVSQLDDGTVIYKVRFTCDGKRYSYQINATTGAVIDKSTEAVTEDTAKRSGKHGRHGTKDGSTSGTASGASENAASDTDTKA